VQKNLHQGIKIIFNGKKVWCVILMNSLGEPHSIFRGTFDKSLLPKVVNNTLIRCLEEPPPVEGGE
jgi:hypothetical protein